MRVIGYTQDSTADGEGVRDVLFVSGCTHACLGCHNKASWDSANGALFTSDVYDKLLLQLLRMDAPAITISGGDPLHKDNYSDVLVLCKSLYAEGVDIWLYTGYTLKEIYANNMCDILKYISVVVDGPFEVDKRDKYLPFRGSTNQLILRKGVDYCVDSQEKG